MNKYSVVLLTVLCLTSCGHKPQQMKLPPPKVMVGKSKSETVPVYVDAIGHFTAINSVDIQAQVEGELVKIHYEQGLDVQEGDLLVTIDPRPYEAALAKSEAQLAENLASLSFAKDRVNRYATLVTQNYVSQLDYDQYVTNMQALEAQIKKDEASILEAEINLGYCYIRAPFSGQCGKKLVDEGNLINNDGSTLVTIRQMDPIYVDFTISERDLPKVQKYQSLHELPVQVIVPDDSEEMFTGKLIVIDNTVDESIGMVKMRGELPNEKKKLWPGQFVRVKLVLFEQPNTVLIPLQSVNNGQKGKYVYLLNDDNEAVYQNVVLGETYGDWIEVKKGVEPNQTIVTKGQINLRPGSKVTIVKGKE